MLFSHYYSIIITFFMYKYQMDICIDNKGQLIWKSDYICINYKYQPKDTLINDINQPIINIIMFHQNVLCPMLSFRLIIFLANKFHSGIMCVNNSYRNSSCIFTKRNVNRTCTHEQTMMTECLGISLLYFLITFSGLLILSIMLRYAQWGLCQIVWHFIWWISEAAM